MMVLVKKDVTQSGGILEESNDYLCLLWREIDVVENGQYKKDRILF